MIVILFILVIFGAIGGVWANSKNLNAGMWAVICGLFPIIGLIFLAFAKPGQAS